MCALLLRMEDTNWLAHLPLKLRNAARINAADRPSWPACCGWEPAPIVRTQISG
jgi:hypothetical protein